MHEYYTTTYTYFEIFVRRVEGLYHEPKARDTIPRVKITISEQLRSIFDMHNKTKRKCPVRNSQLNALLETEACKNKFEYLRFLNSLCMNEYLQS